MKPNHTPGPWKYYITKAETEIRSVKTNQTIALVSCEAPNAVITPECNARLIAAAPEMLEALKTVLKDLYLAGEHADAVQLRTVFDAIAKAEGRTE